MDIQAVIFDLDGTLIDSMGIWKQIDHEFLAKRDILVPDDIFDNVAGGNSFVEIADHFKTKFNLAESLEDIMQEWTDMTIHHYQNNISLKHGAIELLKFCKKKNIKLGIGTSNNDKLTNAVLKANDVQNYFQAIVTSDNINNGKPFPDIFLKVAEILGVKPENCIVIEDVLVGIQAAKNAGMTVFSIYDEHSSREMEKIKELADFNAKDYKDIVKKIKEISNISSRS